MSTLKFVKTRSVNSPSRGTKKSAGIDLFVPVFDDRFIKDLKDKNPQISDIRPDNHEWILFEDNKIILAPGAALCIPSGIHILGQEEIAYNMHNKSGIGTKKRLDRLAEVVDQDYQGEIHISITNTSQFMIIISEGEKLIQMLEMKVKYSDLEEIESLDKLYLSESERGANGFGSTN